MLVEEDKKTKWNNRRKELNNWTARAKAVGIKLLPPKRPKELERLAWEQKIVQAENARHNMNINNNGEKMSSDIKHNNTGIHHLIETRRYEKFRFIRGNRKLNERHLKNLMRSFQEHYLNIPIIVNEKMEIIDGQHRFTAAMELGLPISYTKIKGMDISDVHRLNSNNKNWGYRDYAKGYADLGYRDYVIFNDFIKKYEFGCFESIIMLANVRNSSQIRIFREGRFKVKSLDYAIMVAEQIISLKDYFVFYKGRSFVLSIIYLSNNPLFSFDYFYHQLGRQSNKLKKQSTRQDYIEVIEKIYNHRKRERIRF